MVLFDREEQWGLQGTEKWFVYERQIDFENGTAHIHAARGQSGGWPTIYTESHSFAPMAGPTNLRYLCLSGFGSSSGWKVYDHVQIAQVWIGSLDDAFPTRGQIWTV